MIKLVITSELCVNQYVHFLKLLTVGLPNCCVWKRWKQHKRILIYMFYFHIFAFKDASTWSSPCLIPYINYTISLSLWLMANGHSPWWPVTSNQGHQSFANTFLYCHSPIHLVTSTPRGHQRIAPHHHFISSFLYQRNVSTIDIDRHVLSRGPETTALSSVHSHLHPHPPSWCCQIIMTSAHFLCILSMNYVYVYI